MLQIQYQIKKQHVFLLDKPEMVCIHINSTAKQLLHSYIKRHTQTIQESLFCFITKKRSFELQKIQDWSGSKFFFR